ncbi:MAG: phage baseplate assembly protein V [Rikenella sp.]|nr:phage baseplate assembly protein V [Rikenella sp.]
MLRLGIISELGDGENLGFARVSFDDSEIVSGWLSLPSSNSRTVKQWIPVEVNSQVACLMDDFCEQGCIVAVLWSETDTPPDWAMPDTLGIRFGDGTEIYYDAGSHTLTVNAPDAELNFKCKKLNVEGDVAIIGKTEIQGDASISGNASVTGDVAANGEITAGPLKIALTKHKHTTPMGPSGTPIP